VDEPAHHEGWMDGWMVSKWSGNKFSVRFPVLPFLS
jgi:hypothetical protein